MRRERRTRFPNHRLQRKPLVKDPVMHHGTCVTHVPWCMSGSLSRGCRKNVHGIHGACATRNFTYLARGIWMRYLERDNGVYGDIRPANPQHLNYSHHRVNISRNVGMEAWYRQLKLLILSILQHSFIITLDRWIKRGRTRFHSLWDFFLSKYMYNVTLSVICMYGIIGW